MVCQIARVSFKRVIAAVFLDRGVRRVACISLHLMVSHLHRRNLHVERKLARSAPPALVVAVPAVADPRMRTEKTRQGVRDLASGCSAVRTQGISTATSAASRVRMHALSACALAHLRCVARECVLRAIWRRYAQSYACVCVCACKVEGGAARAMLRGTGGGGDAARVQKSRLTSTRTAFSASP